MLLSVLDLSFITTATGPSQALRTSVELAILADRLGYHRYWTAEHHNLASVAISAPEILMTHVAGQTTRIRIGAGGVMLPNHAPLMVAERFKTMAALFPNRVDLGLGRAPGTDPVTSYALRRHQTEGQGDDFLQRLQELLLYETGDFPKGHPFRSIAAMPSDAPLPPIYILGSSDYGAALAARTGLGFAFAHHFASHDATTELRAYRDTFVSTGWRPSPHAILAVNVISAPTRDEAERLAASADLNGLRRAKGIYRPLPPPEEAASHVFSEQDRAIVASNRRRMFVGAPEEVAASLMRLVLASGADEIMITTPVFDHAARLRSYELMFAALAAVDASATA